MTNNIKYFINSHIFRKENGVPNITLILETRDNVSEEELYKSIKTVKKHFIFIVCTVQYHVLIRKKTLKKHITIFSNGLKRFLQMHYTALYKV